MKSYINSKDIEQTKNLTDKGILLSDKTGKMSKISFDDIVWIGTVEQYLLLDSYDENIFYCIEEEAYDIEEQ